MGDPALIVPTYNEASRWSVNYWEKLTHDFPNLHVIFVNDGSTDSTPSLLKQTANLVGGEYLELKRNSGKAEAVRAGMNAAIKHGALHIGFIDADGAFAVNEAGRIHAILEQVSESDRAESVWTSRVALAGRQIQRSLARHYLGRVMATYVLWGQTGVPYDSQSGLKWFCATNQLSQVLETPFRTRWLFEVEILARHIELGGRPLRIWEEPVLEWTEVSESKVTKRELVRIWGEARLARRAMRNAAQYLRGS